MYLSRVIEKEIKMEQFIKEWDIACKDEDDIEYTQQQLLSQYTHMKPEINEYLNKEYGLPIGTDNFDFE